MGGKIEDDRLNLAFHGRVRSFVPSSWYHGFRSIQLHRESPTLEKPIQRRLLRHGKLWQIQKIRSCRFLLERTQSLHRGISHLGVEITRQPHAKRRRNQVVASLRKVARGENERFNHRLLRLANDARTSLREVCFEARPVGIK